MLSLVVHRWLLWHRCAVTHGAIGPAFETPRWLEGVQNRFEQPRGDRGRKCDQLLTIVTLDVVSRALESNPR